MAIDPGWLDEGLAHVWLPYAQMKTAPRPLPVVATEGARLVLADGRTLIDGVASWWTACHGYNHPSIAAAVREQLARMPHVMFGGLAHEPAYRLATRLASMLPASFTGCGGGASKSAGYYSAASSGSNANAGAYAAAAYAAPSGGPDL